VLYALLAEAILAVFFRTQDALFTLFGAATLLPAVIYLAAVLLFVVKRRTLPPTTKFNLGRFETPITVVALVWLIFELAIFRDASFKKAWLYVVVLVVIGAAYLAGLYARRGRHGLAMPELRSIDAELDAAAQDGSDPSPILEAEQGAKRPRD